MNAEIITIGDEILIGQIIDTNSQWIGKHEGRKFPILKILLQLHLGKIIRCFFCGKSRTF